MRRTLFALACFFIALTGVGAPRAASEKTDFEASAYEGDTSGSWLCGGAGRVRYGGITTRVRHSQREATEREGAGATVVAGAAMEVGRVTTTADPPDYDDPSSLVPPEPDGQTPDEPGLGDAMNNEQPRDETQSELETHDVETTAGVDLRVGYHWKHLGFELGAAYFAGAFLPQGELTLGRRDRFYLKGGMGVPSASWALRPALAYGGAGVAFRDIRSELFVGYGRVGPSTFADLRLAGEWCWYVPIRDRLDLRGSLYMSDGITLGRQAALGLSWELQ